ncbi:MAG: leucine-rich repeat domain-containing protein [Imperialibacter sp.]|uniref:leucine-rich repeat domain-containing protein n=1 Tax=Imperialibacter sp. TaxID=2038411 RepID=UPI0032EC05AC
MGRISLRYAVVFLLVGAFSTTGVFSQAVNLNQDDLKIYEQKSKDLVSFLQFMLNTVGDQTTSARDKEVIISESYLKVFRDGKVQIEDDLLTDRQVVINKDVQAYFKDVDFFFKHVSFEFEILKVEPLKRDNGQWYFKVETNRLIKGAGIEGDAVSNTRKRFIEINLDAEKDDLKIASIYTTKVSREKALRAWWNTLSYEWMALLQQTVAIIPADSVSNAQLETIATIDSLDISDNRYLADINPLEMLPDLVYLKMSNTRITDLSPVRSLSNLQHLDISNTKVEDITFLKYSEKLNTLDASLTPVYDLSELAGLSDLRVLLLKGIPAADFSAIGLLTELRWLDVSQTSLSTTASLIKLSKLEELNISSTAITSLEGLENLSKLNVLQANSTFVSDLSPLSGLSGLKDLMINDCPVSSLDALLGIASLEKVYCDNTSVSDKQADDFMSKKKKTLVVMNSRQLDAWWTGLTGEWRLALMSLMQVPKGQKPTKEQLVKLVNMDSLVLANKMLSNLLPLERFKKLNYLDISKNPIDELISLSRLGDIKVLKANDTPIENIAGLKGIVTLERIELINTKVYDLEVLQGLPRLQYLNLDDTFVSRGSVVNFIRTHPDAVVIFQTKEVMAWWEALSVEWQTVFRQNQKLSPGPTSVELHRLIAQTSIDAAGSSVKSLAPLYAFLDIKTLNLSGIGLSSLTELSRLDNLEVLNISKNPVSNLLPIQGLIHLTKLDVSNTAVADLREIEYFRELESLNCAGTQLKNLKGIERFGRLKEIDFSNTKVGRLDRLVDIKGLQSLTCFNTKVSEREIEDFKAQQPDCNVTFY